jgi:hypothetical protein
LSCNGFDYGTIDYFLSPEYAAFLQARHITRTTRQPQRETQPDIELPCIAFGSLLYSLEQFEESMRKVGRLHEKKEQDTETCVIMFCSAPHVGEKYEVTRRLFLEFRAWLREEGDYAPNCPNGPVIRARSL